MLDDRRAPAVPWRTIWATIGCLLVTVAAALLIAETHRVLLWLVVAAFFAVALDPAVDALVRRLHLRRAVATTIVVFAGMVALTAIVYVLVRPLVTEAQQLADDVPRFVEDVRNGQGPIGELVARYNLQDRLADQQQQFQGNLQGLGTQSVRVVSAVGTGVAATLTVFVLTFLMLVDAPAMLRALMGVIPPERRERVSRVAADCSRSVTGYVAGNLLISVVAGALTYVFLWIAGVPFRGVLALFVAIADLIPLVGATLGAVVVSLVCVFHSPATGIAAVVFFVVYQQFENHVLQPVIQARTVKLSPLTVLVSVLLGVELAGMLGALLAIPVAGIIKVIARDVWDERQGRTKPEATVGEERVPAGEAGEHHAVDAGEATAPALDLREQGDGDRRRRAPATTPPAHEDDEASPAAEPQP